LETAETARFEARARDVLDPFANMASFERAVADVVVAMRWAKTQ